MTEEASSAGGSIGTARVDVVVNTATMEPGVEAAKRKVSGLGDQAAQEFNKANASTKRYAESLLRQADLLGKTRAEQIAYNAQTRIGGELGAQIAAKALAQQEALKGAALGAKALGDELKSASFGNSQLLKVNQALGTFKTKAAEAAQAAKSVGGQLTSQQFSDVQLLRVNRALGDLKTQFISAASSAKQASIALTSQQFSPTQLFAANKALSAYRKELAASNSESVKTSVAFGKTGKSAGELAFAMRSLPAQITDIFVGLSTGQRPLTVLLQQGGQLKDLFGGIGPAAKALGSSLLGLVNPFTVTAAAAATLLIAFKEGSDESEAYNKALITTGNYAGITAGQLDGLARNISHTVGTQHEAAAALAEVAASGKFTAEQMALVGRAALDQARLNGQATSQTIAQFARLRDEPVKAILALNDAEHFLTESSYARIKALEDEGRQQDAATLAIQTYSRALDERRAEVLHNTGLIEKAWNGVASAAKSAWDRMLDIGRQDTGQQKFDALFDQLDKLKNSSFAFADLGPIGSEARQKRIAQIREQLAQLQDDAKKAAQEASQKRIAAELVQDRADSDREVQAFATNAQKRAAAIIKTQQEYNDRIQRALTAGDKALADKLRADEKLVLAGIADKFKDPKTPKSPEISAFATFKGQVDALQVKNITGDNSALTQYEQGIRKLADEMGVYLSKSGDATKAAAEFNRGQQALAETLARAKQQETDAERAYAAALEKSNQVLADQVNAQVERIGSGQKEFERSQQLTRAYQDQAAALAELALKRQMGIDGKAGGISQDQYDADVSALRAATEEKVRILKDGFNRQDAAQANWLNGAKAAYQDYVDQASDVAGQTYDLFNNAFTGLGDALASFVTTGKLNFKGLVTSILSDLAKMETRILASQILQSIVGSISGGKAFSGGGGTYSADTGGLAAYNVSPYAKGGIFASSPSLSAYSGNVIDRPTMFAFARGAGIMGEAGPEAIMPLRRGPDGRLGVAASGGQGDTNISVSVQIQSDGSSSVSSDRDNQAFGRQIGNAMVATARQEIARATQPGGLLWKRGTVS